MKTVTIRLTENELDAILHALETDMLKFRTLAGDAKIARDGEREVWYQEQASLVTELHTKLYNKGTKFWNE